MQVKDIMTKEVVTVTPEMSLKEVGILLRERRISGLPVLDGAGVLVGIITLTDMLKVLDRIYKWKQLERMESDLMVSGKFEQEKENAKVGDFMTEEVMTLTEDASLDFLRTKMFNNGIHTLPVVKNGKLVGVVGKRDLICACF